MKGLPYVLILTTLALTACGDADADARDSPAAAEQPAGAEQSTAAEQPAAEAAAEGDLRMIEMTVPSMSCPLCLRSIQARLEEAGLADIRIDLDTKLVQARFDPDRITSGEVEALVEGQGFPVEDSRILTAEDVEGGGP